VESPSQWDLLS
jgi:hypothetical protein